MCRNKIKCCVGKKHIAIERIEIIYAVSLSCCNAVSFKDNQRL